MARFPPFFTGVRATLVRADGRAVDHHVCSFVIGGQMPENPFNHTDFAPATQSSVNILSVTKADSQVTPGNTCTVTILDRAYKQMIVRISPTDTSYTTRHKIFYPLALTIVQIMPARLLSIPTENNEKTSRTAST